MLSPQTGAVIDDLTLVPNVNLGRLIREHHKKEHATIMACFAHADLRRKREQRIIALLCVLLALAVAYLSR